MRFGAEGDGAHLELPTRQPHHAQRQAAPGGGGEHGLEVGHAVAAAALVGLGLGREAHVVAKGVAREDTQEEGLAGDDRVRLT